MRIPMRAHWTYAYPDGRRYTTAGGAVKSSEWALMQLSSILLHTVDKCVLRLTFAVGDGVSTTVVPLDLVFEDEAERSEFFKQVYALRPDVPVARNWAEFFPRRLWVRFRAEKVRRGRRARSVGGGGEQRARGPLPRPHRS